MKIDNFTSLILLGQKIREKRKELGLSQEALAYIINVDRRHLSAMENGKQNMTLDTFFRVAKGLNMNPATLLMEIFQDEKKFNQ